jgi:hypothetical protein
VITIAGKAPEHNRPSSLTSEAYGAYYAAKSLNEVFPSNLTLPAVRILADNQSLLNGLSYRQMTTNPSQCLQPEHELMHSTIANLTRSPDIKFEHVKGHQDPTSSFEVYLNNECDSIATAARQFSTPTGPAKLTHRTATLILNGKEVTSKYGEHLRCAYSSQALRSYYVSKFPTWHSNVVDNVDWYIKGKALGLLHGRNQKTVLQLLHNWLPVNGHPGSGKTGEAKFCPYCNTTEETLPHFLSCCHPTAAAHRTTMQASVRQHLLKSKTHPQLIHLVLSSLQNQSDPVATPETADLIQRQQKIGWDHVLKGNWSLSWVRTYDALHQSHSGEQWGISLLRKIWSEFYQMWKHRCDHLHGTTLSIQRQHLLREVTPKIEQFYAESGQLLHVDQQFFRQPEEDILKLPNSRLENWVHRAERHIKASRARAKREANKTTKALTTFYPLFSTRTSPATIQHTKRRKKINRTYLKKIHQPSTPHSSIRQFFTPIHTPLPDRNPYAKPKQPVPATSKPPRQPPPSSTNSLTSYFRTKPKDSFPHHNTEKPP